MAMPINGTTLYDISINGSRVYTVNHVHNGGSPVTVWKQDTRFILSGTFCFSTDTDTEDTWSGCTPTTDYNYSIFLRDGSYGGMNIAAYGIKSMEIYTTVKNIKSYGWWWKQDSDMEIYRTSIAAEYSSYFGWNFSTQGQTVHSSFDWNNEGEGEYFATTAWSTNASYTLPYSKNKNDSGITFTAAFQIHIELLDDTMHDTLVELPLTAYFPQGYKNNGNPFSCNFYYEASL